MFKSFVIIAIVCSPYFECMQYEQKEKKFFRSYEKCMAESKIIGDQIYKNLVQIGIPFRLEINCEENKRWQA
jgi:hypothetical protein